MSIQQFFQSLGERLQKSANVKTVYGEPMVAEGKTIVPVARVAYGFCGCSRNKKQKGESKAQNEGAEEGGGAGLTASPVGVVEVTSEGTRFVAIGEERKWAGALIIGLFLGIFLGRRRSGR